MTVTTIKLKRGPKSNLGLLSSGEPAFTTDTKELFIGDGTTNNLINSSTASTIGNFLTNGNFQVLDDVKLNTGNDVVVGGTSKWLYGPYIFQNYGVNDLTIKSSAVGVSEPEGMLSFASTQTTRFSIGYRHPLSYTGLHSLTGKTVSLSFDYDIVGQPSPVNFTYGMGGATKSGTLPANSRGRWSGSFVVTQTNPISNIEYYLFDMTDTFNTAAYPVRFGNFKLELGNTATPFVPFPYLVDRAAVNVLYKRVSTVTRVSKVQANTLSAPFGETINSDFNIGGTTPPRFTLGLTTSVIKLDGTLVTGFGFSVVTQSPGNYVIQASKNAHGMTDGSIIVDCLIDYRR